MVRVFTAGHSTREMREFLSLLHAYEIRLLVDVRTVPKSRHVPQFSKEQMGAALPANGIEYQHWPELGGLRKPQKDSVNLGWRNESFRGYADYMMTNVFWEVLDRLIAAAEKTTLCIMCAEAVPWRCHRSLIGDALVSRGCEVVDILDVTQSREHRMTPFANTDGGRLTYPKEQTELPL